MMMRTESATISSLPWLWVIEALANFKQVDVVTLNDFVSKAPKFPETVGKDAREIVALRCLENVFGSGSDMPKDLPSTSGSKIGFDLSESSEVVLHRILAEVPTLDMGMTRSVVSKWDVHPFILQKRGTLRQSALEQLKNSIIEGTQPYAVNLRGRSGLAHRIRCTNGTSVKGVDDGVIDHQISQGSGSLIQSISSNRNENRGLQIISSRSVLSSKRCRDDSACDCSMHNDDVHYTKRKKSKQEVVSSHTNDKSPPNDGVGCEGRKESLLPVSLERDLSPRVVDDEHVSPNMVEQRSDGRVDVPLTTTNICDLSRDSRAVGLDRERYIESLDDEYVSADVIKQHTDDLNNQNQNMSADKVTIGNECSVELHGPSSASALKGKQLEISDDDFENDCDGSIPLEGADLFIQFEEPDDFFLRKEPGVCIPLEEPDIHSQPVEPAIHSPREETNVNLPFKPDSCLSLEEPGFFIPLEEPVHIPHKEPAAVIPHGEPDGCILLKESEVHIPFELPEFHILHEEPEICVAFAEPQVAASDGLDKDTDGKEIKNDAEPNSPGQNASDYDLEEIDVSARKSDFLSSQCNLSEDTLSTTDWTEFNLCMKCKMDGQLLRCCSAVCPVVVHEVCLFSSASLDKEGNFYCPFCAYSHAISVYLEVKKKAASERRKLVAFVGGRQQRRSISMAIWHKKKQRQSKEHGDLNLLVDTHSNEKFREKEGSQANCEGEHSSQVSNYSIREQEDDKVQEDPPISGTNKNVSHIIGTNGSGEIYGAEYSKVPASEPAVLVQGHENQFAAADLEGYETSKDDKGKSAKSKYSIRVQKEKKKYTYPALHMLRRKTVPWTTEEEETLMEGLKKFSSAEDHCIPWGAILDFGGTALQRRTAVDLKDKWRNICRRIAFNKSRRSEG